MNDKKLLDKTLLSPFTIVENNFVGLTNKHFDSGDNSGLAGKSYEIKKRMQEQLAKTNHDIRLSLYHLSKIIDSGEFHIPIIFGKV